MENEGNVSLQDNNGSPLSAPRSDEGPKLECPMCGEIAFVINPENESEGTCYAESKVWSLSINQVRIDELLDLARIETEAEVQREKDVTAYINGLGWADDTPDYIKDIVAGNIRGFAGHDFRESGLNKFITKLALKFGKQASELKSLQSQVDTLKQALGRIGDQMSDVYVAETHESGHRIYRTDFESLNMCYDIAQDALNKLEKDS